MDPLYFLKDQTSRYINICISSSKMVFYKKKNFFTGYLSTTRIQYKPELTAVELLQFTTWHHATTKVWSINYISF